MTDQVQRFAALYSPSRSMTTGCPARGYGLKGSERAGCCTHGAGKTVVGEFAVWLALETGTRCFYTTPIKALSNQVSRSRGTTRRRQGGLVTGDSSVNGDAPVW